MSLIIFTGLDEILLPLEDDSYGSIATAVEKLQQQNILLVPVTNRTRAEVEALLNKIDLNAPFIVEEGSGIFVTQSDRNFAVRETKTVDSYYLHQLGCTYTEARAALKVVQEEINKILRGFGDFDEADIQPLIGGSLAQARRAKAREFSEYFLTPNRIAIKELQKVAIEYGFKVIFGDRLSLIVGQGADEVKAVQWLLQNYRSASEDKLVSVGLGFKNEGLAEVLDTIVPVTPSTDMDWSAKLIATWVESIEKICQEYR